MNAYIQSNTSETDYLGIGLYSFAEAARLLRAPRQSVYVWSRGRAFAPDSERNDIAPIISPDFPELTQENVLTFVDLVEIHVIRIFRENGVSMRTLRIASERLSQKLDTKHPFAARGLETDGKHVFHKDDEADIEQLGAYQYVIEEAALPYFKQLEYSDDVVSAIYPMAPTKSVVLDPKRSFGRPILNLKGIPTQPLYQMSLAGESVDRIARWYRVSVESVNDAILYEKMLAT